MSAALTPLRASRARLASELTPRAPHVRRAGDLSGVMRTVLLALVPCVAFGLFNTGQQANRALAALGRTAADGWRGSLLARLGAGVDASDALDCVLHGALVLAPLLAVTAAVGVACERVFARLRRRRPSPGLSVTVALFTLFLPPTTALWQAALGIAFGVVVGREIFGGTGRNFLNPALAGLAFLYFAYPSAFKDAGAWTAASGAQGVTALQAAALGGMGAVEALGVSWRASFLGLEPGSLGETSTLACLLGGALLVLRGLASWRIIVAACLGLVATVLLLQLGEGPASPSAEIPWTLHLTLGGFAFGVVFMATDPVTAAQTDAGRWVYGFLIGLLVAVIRVQSPVHPDGVVLAILLGNVFAPLIDHAVVQVDVRRRRRRLG